MTSSLSAGCHSTALDGAMSAYSSVCKKTPKTSSSCMSTSLTHRLSSDLIIDYFLASASKTSSESSASATDYRHISAHAHGTGSQTASSSMVVVTSVVYDEQCSCSKTTAITSMVSAAPSYVSSTGLAPYPVPHNGTASTSAAGAMGPAAGTGVLPVTSSATATGSSPPPNYTAAGVRTEMNLAGAAIAAGALAFLL